MSLRKTDGRTGRSIEGRQGQSDRGETHREADRQRKMREVTEAINKGYRNKQIEEAFRS